MKITNEVKEESINRITARNSRTLLLNLSEDLGITSTEKLQKIIPKAVSIRIPGFSSRNKFLKTVFVEFDTQSDAENNFESLQSMTFPVGNLTVSRAGRDQPKVDTDISPTKLYVSGIPTEANSEELKKLFPKAVVNRNDSAKFRNRADFKTFAILEFPKEEDASEAFWASKDIDVEGKRVLILYAKDNVKSSKLIPDKKNGKKRKMKRLQKAVKSQNPNKSSKKQ